MVGRSRPLLGVLLAGAVLVWACKDLLPERKPKVPADSALPPVPAATEAKRASPAMTASELEKESSGFDQIRRTLRRLVAVEEAFFAENGVYTTDFERMGFRPEGESEVRFIWVKRDGWGARGTHAGIKGKDCVVFVGRATSAPATQKYGRRSRAGAIVCDAQATPPPPSAAAATAPSGAANATPRPGSPPPASVDTGNALDAVDPIVVMKVDLRNLVRSQDTYFATQGIYARRTDPLPLQYLWHKGVSLKILSATRDSWSARATHVARPGTTCVIWYGPVPTRPETEVRKRVPDKSAIPVCDE
jgi:hypothetical protein